MRGDDEQQAGMFSYVSPEQRVPADHPLRPMRAMVDAVLRSCRRGSTRCTRRSAGRRSPPERLLRALLLQVLYSVRSERLLMEQLDYNLLFRWFVGPEHGRPDLGRDRVHQEPRAAAARATSPEAFFDARRWRRRAPRGCCRTSISRSTAR